MIILEIKREMLSEYRLKIADLYKIPIKWLQRDSHSQPLSW